MPIIDGKDQEQNGLMQIASLMAVSARTAPKSGGVDDILTAIVHGPEKEGIAKEMEKIAGERNIEQFKRQAQNARAAEVIVLIGVRGTRPYVTNCGGCGYSSCQEFAAVEKKKAGLDFEGPTCLFKALDLGIAVGSAARTAGMLNADNRIFYRMGTAAKRLGYMPEASAIMGIPLSSTGKSPFFDRA